MRWYLNNHPFHSHEVHISLDFQSQHVIYLEQVDGRRVDFLSSVHSESEAIRNSLRLEVKLKAEIREYSTEIRILKLSFLP